MKGMLKACITGGAEKEWVEYEVVDTTTVKQLKGGSMGAEICVRPSLGKPTYLKLKLAPHLTCPLTDSEIGHTRPPPLCTLLNIFSHLVDTNNHGYILYAFLQCCLQGW